MRLINDSQVKAKQTYPACSVLQTPISSRICLLAFLPNLPNLLLPGKLPQDFDRSLPNSCSGKISAAVDAGCPESRSDNKGFLTALITAPDFSAFISQASLKILLRHKVIVCLASRNRISSSVRIIKCQFIFEQVLIQTNPARGFYFVKLGIKSFG